jgi:DNA repair protein RadC
MKIKDLQREERPREKMVEKGAEELTDIELISIILRSGGRNESVVDLSRQLIIRFKGLKGLLSADINELVIFNNLGIAKASSIKALEEISKRYIRPDYSKEYFVKTPKDVFNLIRKDLLNKEQEYLFLLSLDCRNRLLSKDLISKGTINETLIHPREVFKKALMKNACSIILAHNHPSNNSSPSTEDINITKRIFRVGVEMGIPLADHVVLTNNDYSSMKAQKLLTY